MTHEPERVEDVIAEVERGVFGDALTDQTIRLRAALSHERESKRLAVMKVAHDMRAWSVNPEDSRSMWEASEEWAAALRKAVE